MSEQKANIGVVGMAVMGSNLARNLAHHGYTVAIYNRTFAKTQQVLADHGDEGKFIGSETVEGFVQSIEHPRSIILMVKAGAATDATIAELLPHLEQGDIIIEVAQQPVASAAEFFSLVDKNAQPGKSLLVRFTRGDNEPDITVIRVPKE